MQNPFSCGFDLGGTKMLCIILDDKQKIVARKRKKTKGTEGAQAGVMRIAELIRETFTENNLEVAWDRLSWTGRHGQWDCQRRGQFGLEKRFVGGDA
jgi:predicted NBD/HSP70 family sugar kinase